MYSTELNHLFQALHMKSGYDGGVFHMATESQAKCEQKGNFKKLVSGAAWMQESADNHETSFKIEAFFLSQILAYLPILRVHCLDSKLLLKIFFEFFKLILT